MKRLSVSEYYEETVLLHLLYEESESPEPCLVRLAPRRFLQRSCNPASFFVEYYDGRGDTPVYLHHVPLPPTVRNGKTVIDLPAFLAQRNISLTAVSSRAFAEARKHGAVPSGSLASEEKRSTCARDTLRMEQTAS